MNNLNPAQQAAVAHPGGPLLILAGAGSGKTRVLTERMARIIREGEARPWEILAVTFTNKAARELRTRLYRLLWPHMTLEEAAKEWRSLWIGTFHAVCARLLRFEAGKLPTPYGPGFTLYDETDQSRAMKDVLAELRIDADDIPPKMVLSAISRAKNQGFGPFELAQNARLPKDDAIAEIFEHYQVRLGQLNAMDYDDILVLAGQLLATREDVREYWQRRFRHILVDEYQDTNLVQFKLIKLLAGGHLNLTAVGDVDQSIYSFRAADFRIILQFERDFPDTTRITLEENYRSVAPILEVANQVINHNIARYPKVLRATRQGEQPIHVHVASDERDEAWWVVDRILELAGKPGEPRTNAHAYSYESIAVLYRTNAQSRIFEEALATRRIPYRLIGGIKFFDRKEVKDVVAYLRLILNPRDDVAFGRVINVPRRGIGASTVTRLKKNAAAANLPLLPAVRARLLSGIGGSAAKKLEAFATLMGLLAPTEESTPEQLIRRVLESTGYVAELADDMSDEGRARLDNVRELLTRADEMMASGEASTLEEFLTGIPLQGADDTPATAGTADDKGLLTLMTLHSAKGLEYPIVFLPGLEEGIFPHQRSVGEEASMEEERRLCYVGITRAGDRLFLSYAETRRISGTFRRNVPSRFLTEMPQALMERTESPELQRYIRARVARDERDRWAADGDWADDRSPQLPRPKPTALIAESEVEWAQAFDNETPDFSVGDRVVHPKFGPGEVAKVDRDRRGSITLHVDFGTAGTRMIDPVLARIERV